MNDTRQDMLQSVLKRTLLLFVVALVISGAMAFGYTASSADITLQVPILGKTSVPDFAAYILLLYKFFVGSVGLIAVVMIMIGGFQWIMAAGNSQRIESAKETIFSAIAGLVIALGSYTILFIINPNLTTLKIPALPSIKTEELATLDCQSIVDKSTYACNVYFEYDFKSKTFKTPGLDGGSINKKKIQKGGYCMGTWCGKLDSAPLSNATSLLGGCYSKDSNPQLGDEYQCIVAICPKTTEGKNCSYYSTSVTSDGELFAPQSVRGIDARGQLCKRDVCQLSGGKGCNWVGGLGVGACTVK